MNINKVLITGAVALLAVAIAVRIPAIRQIVMGA